MKHRKKIIVMAIGGLLLYLMPSCQSEWPEMEEAPWDDGRIETSYSRGRKWKYLDQIIDVEMSNLHETDLEKLEEIIRNMCEKSPLGKSCFQYFIDVSRGKIALRLDSTSKFGGTYDPKSHRMPLSSITEVNFYEEFIHAAQCMYYKNYPEFVNGRQLANIEFEAKVLVDIIHLRAVGLFMGVGIFNSDAYPPEHANEYIDMIYRSLGSHGFRLERYLKFQREWYQVQIRTHTPYGKLPLDEMFLPNFSMQRFYELEKNL